MPKVPSLLYLKPHLFAVTDTGQATCLRAATGEVVSLWDSLIPAAARASGASGRITEVLSHGQDYGSVKAVDPFLQT